MRRGFTLIELLVVVVIIGLISVVALPTIIPAIQHRQVTSAAQLLQGALVGARDRAIHDNQPCGIRLLPDPNNNGINPTTGAIDPNYPLAYDRIIPIGAAPEYNEGYCTTIPESALSGMTNGVTYTYSDGEVLTWGSYSVNTFPPELILVESPLNVKQNNSPNPPTNWFWNIRVGDKIQINGAGVWYTVVGPMAQKPADGNTDMFVNAGAPAAIGTYGNVVPTLNGQAVEFLELVNGIDDNQNGFVDEGWDGVDNNSVFGIDEYNPSKSQMVTFPPPPAGSLQQPIGTVNVVANEWETEGWQGSLNNTPGINLPYVIQRRAVVQPAAREIALPKDVVIDATTWGAASPERSRLPVNIYNGTVDILVRPDGTVTPSIPYGCPASVQLGGAFYHFWLAERQDAVPIQLQLNANGLPVQPTVAVAMTSIGSVTRYLPINQPGGANSSNAWGPYLKGEFAVLSLNARSGAISVNSNPPFFFDSALGYTNEPTSSAVYNQLFPVIQAEQGVNGQ